MDEKQKKTYLYGAIALLILLFLLLLFVGVYVGQDPEQPNMTNNSSGPGFDPAENGSNNNSNSSNNDSNSDNNESNGTNTGTKNDTIYVTPDSSFGGPTGDESGSVIEISTVEGLYGIRNNLNGSYVLMNDLNFGGPNSYDFSHQGAWNYAALQLLETSSSGTFEGDSLENLTDADWAIIKGKELKNGQEVYKYRFIYMDFFLKYWTPIGYIDIESASTVLKQKATSMGVDFTASNVSTILAAMNQSELDAAFTNGFNTSFMGSFDGNGHTIWNLRGGISKTGGKSYLPNGTLDESLNKFNAHSGGLFGVIGSNGSVSNLTLNAGQTDSSFGVGMISGFNFGTISSCVVTANYATNVVSGVRGSNLLGVDTSVAVGGITGVNIGTVRDCLIFDTQIGGYLDPRDGDVNLIGAGGIAGINANADAQWFNADILSALADALAASGVSNADVYANVFAGLVSGGHLSGAGLIENCSVYDSKSESIPKVYILSNKCVGGIAGLNVGGTITQSSVNNVQVEGNESVGGIVGYSFYGTIRDCYTRDLHIVDEKGYSPNFVGGIAGSVYNTSITNCYFTGKISENAVANIGGIAGRISGSESVVKNNVVIGPFMEWQVTKSGAVYGEITSDVVGYSDADNYVYDGIVNAAGADIMTRGIQDGDGTLRILWDFYQQETYTEENSNWMAWDFDSVWKMDAGPYGLPIFKWQEPSIHDFWEIDSMTLNINDSSQAFGATNIHFHDGGGFCVYIYIDGMRNDLNGTWAYDLSTPEFGDIVFSLNGSNYIFKAHVDEKGCLVVEDVDFEFSGTDVNATGIILKESPVTAEAYGNWTGDLFFDIDIDLESGNGVYSEVNLISFGLIPHSDNTWNFSINIALLPFILDGTWDINETQSMGDYLLTFGTGSEEYNARLVLIYGNHYIMIEPSLIDVDGDGVDDVDIQNFVIRDK
ncbi:hypothetical protein MsAg5_07630 [Methanosarcinaceae archaeon Ag5]|uniref:GLUG domain-containing protein n=1 Tax=Methanolapillus africanus TaxID=3028297 RepID=A0AAE4MJC2_9EURY|nr:hypothetical protein [Methanosarcinaceae archaeon Ag5]